MKRAKLCTMLAALALATTTVSCEKPAPLPEEVPTIEVTYDALEGHWMLTHIDGEELFDDTMLYIKFENHTDERMQHRYEMWDNIGSMYLRQTTGTYTLTTEQDGSYTISGTYDNGVGDWNKAYRVVMLPGERMQWWAENSCLEFAYAMEIPDEFN